MITYPSLQRFPEEVNFKSFIVKFDVWSSSLHGVRCHVNSYRIDVYFMCCIFLFFIQSAGIIERGSGYC